jgi:hypothetical protein
VVAAQQISSALWGNIWQWLNATHSGRWIGRGGPIAWPSLSLDVTPMDFFLWGHLKERVCAVAPSTTEDPVARLKAAVATVGVRVCSKNAARLTAVCLQLDEGCLENLL